MAGKVDNRTEILEELLQSGIILLKKDHNSAGEPVILQKLQDKDWHTRLTFSTEKIRNKHFDYLTTHKRNFFRRG